MQICGARGMRNLESLACLTNGSLAARGGAHPRKKVCKVLETKDIKLDFDLTSYAKSKSPAFAGLGFFSELSLSAVSSVSIKGFRRLACGSVPSCRELRSESFLNTSAFSVPVHNSQRNALSARAIACLISPGTTSPGKRRRCCFVIPFYTLGLSSPHIEPDHEARSLCGCALQQKTGSCSVLCRRE